MTVTIRRRELLVGLGGAAAAWPLAARAQQGERVRRVGVLMGYVESDPAAQAQVAALQQELRKLGWEEGRNIRVDVRFSCGCRQGSSTGYCEGLSPPTCRCS